MIIQNISKKRIEVGNHLDPSAVECDLIQISDAATFPPVPAYKGFFKEQIHLDFEDGSDVDYGAINPEQVKQLVDFMIASMKKKHFIVVHCFKGISRSGAVVEFAVRHLGYEAMNEHRNPNQFMLKEMETYFAGQKNKLKIN